jgi:hypothetical protein
MKAEEYVHKITDLYDNSGDEAAAIKLLKQYANQKVIEELEEIISRLEKKSFTAHSIEEVEDRIKELKQE